MKITVLLIALLALFAFAQPAMACSSSDSCEIGDATSGCNASIRNCDVSFECAYCNCNSTACGCSCRERDHTPADLMATPGRLFSSLYAKWSFSYDMDFRGLVWWLNQAKHDGHLEGWTIVSTVRKDKTFTDRRLYGVHLKDEAKSLTVLEILQDMGAQWGVCVDGSDETRTIVFRNCS